MKISTHPSKHSANSNLIHLVLLCAKSWTEIVQVKICTQNVLHTSNMKHQSPEMLWILLSDQLSSHTNHISEKKETDYQSPSFPKKNLEGWSFVKYCLGLPQEEKLFPPLIWFNLKRIKFQFSHAELKLSAGRASSQFKTQTSLFLLNDFSFHRI